jgi:peptide/nickel transport system ATP-binding protein
VTGRRAKRRAIALLEDTGIPAAAERIDHFPHQVLRRHAPAGW